MDILEFRLRVIMALRMAGLSEAQAEDEARANLVTLAVGHTYRKETPGQVAQAILNRRFDSTPSSAMYRRRTLEHSMHIMITDLYAGGDPASPEGSIMEVVRDGRIVATIELPNESNEDIQDAIERALISLGGTIKRGHNACPDGYC